MKSLLGLIGLSPRHISRPSISDVLNLMNTFVLDPDTLFSGQENTIKLYNTGWCGGNTILPDPSNQSLFSEHTKSDLITDLFASILIEYSFTLYLAGNFGNYEAKLDSKVTKFSVFVLKEKYEKEPVAK